MKSAAIFLILFFGASNLYAFDHTHALYADVLKSVLRDGRVDYAKLKSNPAPLQKYLRTLSEVSPADFQKWDANKKLSFWINAYNALTFKAIIDHYPIQSSFVASLRYPKNSIRQIPGVWDELTFSIMGQPMTLNHIEHEIIRKEFKEPRIHMALVCAALGCPPLREQPFVGERLNKQLDDQAQLFLRNDQKFRLNQGKAEVHLSMIFKWFGGGLRGKLFTRKRV